jgi:hypothetical protein
MTDKDYYAILEVSRNASAKEIKQAYRRLARRYHPDLHPGDKFDEDMFKAVNEAYEALSVPEKRQEYDNLQDELSRRVTYHTQADRQVNRTSKKRQARYNNRFLSWIEYIGIERILRAVILLLIIFTLISVFSLIVLPRLAPVGSDVRGVDCLKIDNTTFQEEVLQSHIPVLVAFCDDELWNREGYEYVVPSIVAVKRIIKKREFENKIKFCRYFSIRDDPILRQYAIQSLPETIIFTNGNVLYWVEGVGSIDKDVEKIEKLLSDAIEKM